MIIYQSHYSSPIGPMTMASDGTSLIGLWFDGQKYFGINIGKDAAKAEWVEVDVNDDCCKNNDDCCKNNDDCCKNNGDCYKNNDDCYINNCDSLSVTNNNEASALRVFLQTRKWLDVYFSGDIPDFAPQIKVYGSDFKKMVADIMLSIPYGKTMTYAEIAQECAKRLGKTRMSAQAVGGAVGHNAISIIIPCHRVLGTDGSLTGYAGGIERKKFMLNMEKSL